MKHSMLSKNILLLLISGFFYFASPMLVTPLITGFSESLGAGAALMGMVGGMMNLMPSAIIQVFGRYDFAQANKIIMPLVIGIRSCAFLIVPMMLAAAGANVNGGFRNAFIICTVLSLIATVLSFVLKSDCIGKNTED